MLERFFRNSLFVALHSRESFQQRPRRWTVHVLSRVDVVLAGLYFTSEVSFDCKTEPTAVHLWLINHYKRLLSQTF